MKRKYRISATIPGEMSNGAPQDIRPGVYYADVESLGRQVSLWIDLVELKVERSNFNRFAKRYDQIVNECKGRVIKIAKEEFPSGRVVFDQNAGDKIRFRIEDLSSGHVLSNVYEHYEPTEIEKASDARLREIIRRSCGLSN